MNGKRIIVEYYYTINLMLCNHLESKCVKKTSGKSRLSSFSITLQYAKKILMCIRSYVCN